MNWALLQNSLLVAGSTTVLAAGLGLIAALWLVTLSGFWRVCFLGLAVAALALPPFMVTNTWLDWLGDNGLLRVWLPFRIYSLGGTVWLLSLMLWPITLFALLAAWRRLEAAQFDADPALTGVALLRWLLLPVARGELALAAVLTFALALNNFAVPVILQTQVLPEEMWIRFNTQLDAVGALKLGVPLVIVPLVLLAWVMRRRMGWPRTQETVSPAVIRRHLGRPWRVACGGVAMVLCLLSVGSPLVQIASARRTWTELAGAVEAGGGAIWNSFWFAASAATVVTVISLAFGSARRRLASSAVLVSWLTFFIPGVLMGIALIKIFNRPWLSAFYQSAGIVLLAFVIRYLAIGWTAAGHALNSTDADLADAARLEGANRWQMLRHVHWPQIAPQILAAWYGVYLLCLWDVESMVMVVPPGGETLALRIFNLLHYGHATQVNALCVVLLGLAGGPLLVWWGVRAAGKSSKRPKIAAHVGNVWSLMFLWMLVLGVWCFGFGCSPATERNEAALRSQFFERAHVIGSRGVGIGEFNKPRSVAVDTHDNVYAVDMTGRVQKFSPEGKYELSWQMPQTTLGKPKGMGCDRDGNILVVEPHYQRVNHFTPEGKLVAQWGCKGTNEGCFVLPRGIAENSRGEFFVSEYMGAERVQRFGFGKAGKPSGIGTGGPLTPALSPSDGERGKRLPARADLNAVGGVALSGAEGLKRTGSDSGNPLFLNIIGKAGTGPGEFNRPEGLCVDAKDRIYVADSCNHRIQIFSSDGKFLRQYGTPGSGLGQLSYPYDIAVDARGNQFVCEFGNSRIQVFDADCRPVEIIGAAGAGPGQFANPWGVALDSHGNLYVADALNHRVQKLVRREPIQAQNEADKVSSIAQNHADASR